MNISTISRLRRAGKITKRQQAMIELYIQANGHAVAIMQNGKLRVLNSKELVQIYE